MKSEPHCYWVSGLWVVVLFLKPSYTWILSHYVSLSHIHDHLSFHSLSVIDIHSLTHWLTQHCTHTLRDHQAYTNQHQRKKNGAAKLRSSEQSSKKTKNCHRLLRHTVASSAACCVLQLSAELLNFSHIDANLTLCIDYVCLWIQAWRPVAIGDVRGQYFNLVLVIWQEDGKERGEERRDGEVRNYLWWKELPWVSENSDRA